MEFRILGPLEIEGPAGEITLGSGKQRALLALLLLHANDVVPAGRLIELLWPDAPPADAAKALQVHVSRLRRALAQADVIRTRPGGYLLELDAGNFDLPHFEQRAEEARSLLAGGEAEAARQAFGDALALWRGAPLAEFASEPFARPEIGRLEELYLAAIEDRIEADLLLGAHAGLVSELETLVARHPFRERLRAQLMLALYRCGRQADALQAYRDARRALAEELGIEPGRPLQELEQSILRQDAALDVRTRDAGLRPGRRAAGLLVGRERELDELLSALEDAAAGRGRLFVVSGESGAGKTRLADAPTSCRCSCSSSSPASSPRCTSRSSGRTSTGPGCLRRSRRSSTTRRTTACGCSRWASPTSRTSSSSRARTGPTPPPSTSRRAAIRASSGSACASRLLAHRDDDVGMRCEPGPQAQLGLHHLSRRAERADEGDLELVVRQLGGDDGRVHRQVLDQLSHPACIRQPDSHDSPPARSQWSAGRTPPSILLRESRRASARRLPVALDEQPRERLRALRGLAVALAGLDDRALHQDVEREREAVDVAEAGLG